MVAIFRFCWKRSSICCCSSGESNSYKVMRVSRYSAPPQASQSPPWFVAKQQLGNNWSLKMSSIDTELLVWEILEQVYQSYWCLGLCSVPIVLTRKPIHKSISTAEAQVVVAVSEVWALLALNSCDPIKPYFSMVKPYSQILFLKIFVAHIEPLLVGNITCPKISVI